MVPDLRAAREQLAERGVEVSEVQVIAGGPPRPARPDDQLDYQGFVLFEDPDGNGWAIQRLSQPLAERTGALAAAEGPRGAPDRAWDLKTPTRRGSDGKDRRNRVRVPRRGHGGAGR